MPAAFRKSLRASATTEGLNETTEGPSMLVRAQSLVSHVGHEHVKWILVAGRCNTLAMHFRSSSLACSCYFVTIWRAGSPTSNGTIDAICCHGALPDRRQGGSDWGRV